MRPTSWWSATRPTRPRYCIARDQILALRRPGRIVVVDEAFADAVPGEPESLAGESLPDVVVLRSLTKTWALAGLRVGYALGAREVLDRMTARRPHWPLGTLQLEAIAACSAPEAVAEAERGAQRLTTLRAEMVCGLTSIGLDVIDGCAPFVLFTVPDAELMRKHLDGKGIAVRRCDTFVGLDGEYLRAAVRPQWPVLVDAMAEVVAMSVRLSDVIDVLDAAYPPRAGAGLGFGRAGLRRPGRNRRDGDRRRRRHRCGRRRGARPRAAARAPPAAAARGRHRRRKHGQGRAACTR